MLFDYTQQYFKGSHISLFIPVIFLVKKVMLGRDMTIVLAPNLLLGHQVSAWCGPRITAADKRTNFGSEDEHFFSF